MIPAGNDANYSLIPYRLMVRALWGYQEGCGRILIVEEGVHGFWVKDRRLFCLLVFYFVFVFSGLISLWAIFTFRNCR